MGALNFFQNIWPLSQIQPQEAHSNTVMTTTLGRVDVSSEHSGSPQGKLNKDQESTEPIDEKMRLSTSIEKKQGPESWILKPTCDKST